MGHGTKTITYLDIGLVNASKYAVHYNWKKTAIVGRPLKKEAGDPMRMTRGVGCHRFVLDMGNRSVNEYRDFEESSHNDSIDWPWIDSKSQFEGNNSRRET